MSERVPLPLESVMADTSTLDYIAFQLYRVECHRQGITPLRWLCLESGSQASYLRDATATYVNWVEGEREAQVRRQTL